MVAKEAGQGGEKDWDLGNSRCKLLYTGVITSKILLCSIGDCIQCPLINHNGQEDEKGCAFCCIVDINTTR